MSQFLRMVNSLEEAARVLPRWPKRKVEGPSGGGSGSAVLVNVSGLDLAREVHAVLVSWCDQVAEQRGVLGLDPELSSWVQTPSGSWVATGGNTGEVVRWLRGHAGWLVEQPWYIDEMWPELLELRRKVRGLMGLWQPSRSMRDLVVEAATSGGTLEEMREVARARRAEG
ncbi:hypothetical protein [Brachybacterium paraconglomeratum]|uniref:hypothetical protein n=1 Tax=Brachybacterium paraconglomeratum TaxID=173362 RepID=UPI0022AF37B7|nr:hypothetical protein [Brachybacterium paraconglomeratum]MCZ4325685.1 hypothetical protein [Brachybacterium paraconglomeratum]